MRGFSNRRGAGASLNEAVAAATEDISLLEPLKNKVKAMWEAIPKEDEDGQIERLKCWDLILADEELCQLVGNADAAKGKEILTAMKEVRALDQIEVNGRISEEEFLRLSDLSVLAEAARRVLLKAKVAAMWGEVQGDERFESDGEIERLAAWEIVLADDELAGLIGSGDAAVGKARLLEMKKVKALDQIKPDGRISAEEFKRLFDVDVLAAAAAAAAAGAEVAAGAAEAIAEDEEGDSPAAEAAAPEAEAEAAAAPPAAAAAAEQ